MSTTKNLTKTNPNENATYGDIKVLEAALKRLIELEYNKRNRRELIRKYEEVLKLIDTFNRSSVRFYPISDLKCYKGMIIGDIKCLKTKVPKLMLYILIEESYVLMQEKNHSLVKARYFYDDVNKTLNRYICKSSLDGFQYDDFLKMIDEIVKYKRCEKSRVTKQIKKGELVIRKSKYKNILEVFKQVEKSIAFARNEFMQLLNFELLRKEWEYVSTKD